MMKGVLPKYALQGASFGKKLGTKDEDSFFIFPWGVKNKNYYELQALELSPL